MRRWSGIAGIVWVVLALVSRLIRGSVPDPNGKHAMQRTGEFYATKSHQTHALAGAAIGMIGLFFFIWFIAGVIDRLRVPAGGPGTAPGGALTVVAVASGAFVALAVMEHVLDNAIGITLHFVKDYKLDPGLAVVLSGAGTGAFVGAMLAIGAATAAAGVVIMRTRTLPVWLAWLGFLITVLALPTFPPLSFIAAIVLAIWALALSVLLLTQAEATPVRV